LVRFFGANKEMNIKILHQPDLINMLRVTKVFALIRCPTAIAANILWVLDLLLDLVKIVLFCELTDMQRMIAQANLIRHCPSLHQLRFFTT
jgi:hypothetical protein